MRMFVGSWSKHWHNNKYLNLKIAYTLISLFERDYLWRPDFV